jgi:hypothetical protein
MRLFFILLSYKDQKPHRRCRRWGLQIPLSENLNLDRRAAEKQHAKQQSQVQIVHHKTMDNPEWLERQMVFPFWFLPPPSPHYHF